MGKKLTEKRKAIHTSSAVYMRELTTIATCNDGSIWIKRDNKNAVWELMKDIPT